MMATTLRFLLLAVSLLLCSLLVSSATFVQEGPVVPNAAGVALSGDGTTAFVVSADVSGAVYAIPLPLDASSSSPPTPYFVSSKAVQYTSIAATTYASPQVVYLLDSLNAQVVSLAITSPPANSTTLVYDLGVANRGLVSAMSYLPPLNIVVLSCLSGFNGSTNDFVAAFNPFAIPSSFRTLYTTPFSGQLAASTISLSRLYYSTRTTAKGAAAVYVVPFFGMLIPYISPLANSTLLYSASTQTGSALTYPGALLLNNDLTILYITDLGQQTVGQSMATTSVLALYPLPNAIVPTTPLSLATVAQYTGGATEVRPSAALDSSQSTLYFAAQGTSGGLYVVNNANASFVAALSPSTAPPMAATSAATSAPQSPTSLPSQGTGPGLPMVNFTFVQEGPVLPNAAGVALSGDGTTAFVVSADVSGAVYAIPLPLDASSSSPPTPYFVSSKAVQYTSIAATTYASPQVVYLLDSLNAQVVSLAITSPPANSTTLVYDLGVANRGLVSAMSYLPPLNIVVLSCLSGFNGSTNDFVAAFNPFAIPSSFRTLYTTPFSGQLAASTISLSRLYYSTRTTAKGAAAVYVVPFFGMLIPYISPLANSTLLYSASTQTGSALTYPGALLLNNDLTILYITDLGQQTVGQSMATTSVLALYPLPNAIVPTTPLSLATVAQYTGGATEVRPSAALDSSQSTLYFAAQGTSGGLYVVNNANASFVAALSPPVVVSSSAPPQSMSSSIAPLLPNTASGSLCVLLFSVPGVVDYPFSIAYSLQLVYNTTAVTGSAGQAVALLSVTGSRVFTNRFGVVFSTPVTLVTSGQSSAPLLHLNSSSVLDGTGLTFSLSSPVQQPGGNVMSMVSQLRVFTAADGVLLEGGTAVLDRRGQAVVSSVPGVVATTIGAADVNSLVANYSTCQAPITFLNGLRPPTQPNVANGGNRLLYSYTISDNSTYTVTTNLSATGASYIAYFSDTLGNQYQRLINITGVRNYTNLVTGTTIISTVSLPNSVSNTTIPGRGSQRFYPYAYLLSAPGVYPVDHAPFLDANGLVFAVSPAVPANGQVGGPLYNTVAVFVNGTAAAPPAVLTELPNGGNPPLLALQKQSYSFRYS